MTRLFVRPKSVHEKGTNASPTLIVDAQEHFANTTQSYSRRSTLVYTSANQNGEHSDVIENYWDLCYHSRLTPKIAKIF